MEKLKIWYYNLQELFDIAIILNVTLQFECSIDNDKNIDKLHAVCL